MRLLILILSALMTMLLPAYGQQEYVCKPHLPAAKHTIASPSEDGYDVKHVLFDLQLNDTSVYISGSVTTAAVVTDAALGEYVFELDSVFTVDSVLLNDVKLPYSVTQHIRTVSLPFPRPQGSSIKAQVFYKGIAANSYKLNRPGLLCDTFSHTTFTLVEPYYAHRWWPCKQSLTDKIDSLDMHITVPAGRMAGCNGKLVQVVDLSGGKKRYEWHSRYPIDYYLISVSVGRYTDYSYYMHFDNSTDSMLFMNYIPNLSEDLQRLIDSTPLFINYMSSLFGRYPFWEEKYGHCSIPVGGGMEHQTMTSLRFSGIYVVVHELAHQWFGDLVTCATWRDIWLNEGFATYAQYLYHDHFRGYNSGLAELGNFHRDAMKELAGSVYVDDTTSSDRIFLGRLTYNKAASVIHMLRYVINDDDKFFAVLRTYLQRYAWGNATTEQFKAVAEEVSGMDLDAFFDQWIYGEGFPYTIVTWNQLSDVVFIRMEQKATWPTVTPLFTMKVPIRLHSSQGDTTVIMDMSGQSGEISFLWSKHVDSLTIDPEKWLLQQNNICVKDDAMNLLQNDIAVLPNPANDRIYVSMKNTKVPKFTLFDMAGRPALTRTAPWNVGILDVDISMLPSGVYLYRIESEGAVVGEGKLVRR